MSKNNKAVEEPFEVDARLSFKSKEEYERLKKGDTVSKSGIRDSENGRMASQPDIVKIYEDEKSSQSENDSVDYTSADSYDYNYQYSNYDSYSDSDSKEYNDYNNEDMEKAIALLVDSIIFLVEFFSDEDNRKWFSDLINGVLLFFKNVFDAIGGFLGNIFGGNKEKHDKKDNLIVLSPKDSNECHDKNKTTALSITVKNLPANDKVQETKDYSIEMTKEKYNELLSLKAELNELLAHSVVVDGVDYSLPIINQDKDIVLGENQLNSIKRIITENSEVRKKLETSNLVDEKSIEYIKKIGNK